MLVRYWSAMVSRFRVSLLGLLPRGFLFFNSPSDHDILPCRNPCRLYIHLVFTFSIGLSCVVRSELGPSPPFPPMRVLEAQLSRALSLVCEVALSINSNSRGTSCQGYLQESSWKNPHNPGQNYSNWPYMVFHGDFHPLKMLCVVVQKYPHVNLKQEAHDTLNQWDFKDSQEPWPIDFCVNMPIAKLARLPNRLSKKC